MVVVSVAIAVSGNLFIFLSKYFDHDNWKRDNRGYNIQKEYSNFFITIWLSTYISLSLRMTRKLYYLIS